MHMPGPKYSLLIIGVLPPPLGGVTVHVQRLLRALEESNIEATFIMTHHLLQPDSLKAFINHKNVHIHASNPFIRFALACLCVLFRKNSFLTYHGNVGRYKGLRNFFDSLAIRLFRWPIVINQRSFNKAIKLNRATQMATAFIPPTQIQPLHPVIQKQLQLLRKTTNILYCTNASNADRYKDGREIYQCSDLVDLFNRSPDKGLVISDPSGSYLKLWNEKGVTLNANILLISSLHDFNAVIQASDVMIRFTTTDGDAISVKEALYLGIPVIATNVIDRPEQVHLVNDDIRSLEEFITSKKPMAKPDFTESGFHQLYALYQTRLVPNKR